MPSINENSDTWRAVLAILQARIESTRNALERDADQATTTMLRGKLHAYRDVLTWPSLELPEGPGTP